MKRLTISILLLVLSCLLLTGCFCQHEWLNATCDDPMTCAKCGETEGEELDHEWVDADCLNPKTCSLCGKTRGEALGHTRIEATCITAPKCTVCGEFLGKPLGHDWEAATREKPKTCSVCSETQGEPLTILDIYPTGKPRHDGTKFLMSEDEYLELFDELANRGKYIQFPATMPTFGSQPNCHDIYSGTLGQQLRLELDPDTKQVVRIIVELNGDAEFTEEAMDDYLLNLVMAYMAADGKMLSAQSCVEYLMGSMQSSGSTQVWSGSLNGVAYRMEIRYHYWTMEIWVENA